MTSKLVMFVLFPCLVIALLLSFAGVQQVEFGDSYYTFMKNVTRDFNSWSFEIPNIPKIPSINQGAYDSGGLILAVIIKIANFFVTFVNVLVSIINIITTIVNVVIKLIQFCLTIIYDLLNFRDSLSVVYL